MIIAFHGMPGKPEWLRHDCGNPNWIDKYWDYSDDPKILEKEKDLVLIGYSWGGSYIAKLSYSLNNIIAAVIYESPMIHVKEPGGNFPVLFIINNEEYNKDSYLRKIRKNRIWHSLDQWSLNRKITVFYGSGQHLKRVNDGHRKIGHGWDISLNNSIYEWIKNDSSRFYRRI